MASQKAGRGGGRLSLMQRQQALLEEQGFSKPPPRKQPAAAASGRHSQRQGGGHYGRGPGGGFHARQEAHLRLQDPFNNATSASRTRAEMPEGMGGEDDSTWDEGASATNSTASRAPQVRTQSAVSCDLRAYSDP